MTQGSSTSGSTNSIFDAARRGERIRGELDPVDITRRLGALAGAQNVDAIEMQPLIAGDQEVRYRGAVFNQLLEKVKL